VNKAIGLETALREMGISAAQTVGVGDAENDHAFLEICGVAAAVQNALPVLKERCDLVTTGDHGAGVCELISQILTDDLRSLGPRRPRTKLPSEPLVAARDVPTAKPEA
jgi:hydroxymethylpyrimidine pyrophosphatase-like HAD family hydrolase